MNIDEILFIIMTIGPWVLLFLAACIIRKNERDLRETHKCALFQVMELKKRKGIISSDV